MIRESHHHREERRREEKRKVAIERGDDDDDDAGRPTVRVAMPPFAPTLPLSDPSYDDDYDDYDDYDDDDEGAGGRFLFSLLLGGGWPMPRCERRSII